MRLVGGSKGRFYNTPALAETNRTPAAASRGAEEARDVVGSSTQGAPSCTLGAEKDEAPQRYLLRALPIAVHQKLKHPVRFHGACLVVGKNPTSDALAAKLSSLGGTVVRCPLEGTLDEAQIRNLVAYLSRLSGASSAGTRLSARTGSGMCSSTSHITSMSNGAGGSG